jgi:cell division septation protein DedD
MARKVDFRLVALLGSALALAGCEDGTGPAFLQGGGTGGASTAEGASSRTVERDVEAPEVFQVSDMGLWDGRPSLGGVWVAHPEVKDPERVIIRNEDNSKFVIGVVYRPERQTPGPKIQVSSDAAEALDMLAGKPARLNVTALRREAVPEEAPDAPDAPTGTLAAAPAVAATTLDDPILAATAALDAAEGKPAAAPAPARPASAAVGSLEKPFVQIGIFSVEGNANNTAEALRRAGMVPTIKPGKMNGKDFWRVIVGPAGSSAERAALLKKIKDLGFNDAYFVTN